MIRLVEAMEDIVDLMPRHEYKEVYESYVSNVINFVKNNFSSSYKIDYTARGMYNSDPSTYVFFSSDENLDTVLDTFEDGLGLSTIWAARGGSWTTMSYITQDRLFILEVGLVGGTEKRKADGHNYYVKINNGDFYYAQEEAHAWAQANFDKIVDRMNGGRK